MSEFVDTNVLVYAEDRDAGPKHGLAVKLVRELWDSGDGVVSIQVLQEFFVTVTRKLKRPMKRSTAAAAVGQYLTWRTVENDGRLLLRAIDLAGERQLSLWDAMIVQAALISGCNTLYSEDLSHGQRFGDLRIINPFHE